MILEATAVRIHGDNIDTDVLYPGPFLNIEEPELMRNHLFEGLDPTLRERLVGNTALVVDANFGSGSSREHVPRAMKASGVQCLVGKSFARIFYRNCINLGLVAIASPELVEAAPDGTALTIDLSQSSASTANSTVALPTLHPFVLETLVAGGLVEWVLQHPPEGSK